jgi:DNA-binding response OmpR family regulator
MARILVVEDDVSLTLSLRLALSRAGHEPLIAHTLAHARRLMTELPPDLVLLDLGLPDGDGLDLLASWRAEQLYLPVIALTARVTPEDRVTGLHSGADDYVTKPFDLPELLARIEAQLRRRTWPTLSQAASDHALDVVELGRLRMSFRTREATSGGAPVTLSDMEFRLLRHLVANRDAVVTRETLLTEVWGLPATSRTRSIDTFIYRLRRLIEDDPAEPRLLVSARGAGYRLLSTRT